MEENIEQPKDGEGVDAVSNLSGISVENAFGYIDSIFDTIDESIKVYETVKSKYNDVKTSIQQSALASNVDVVEEVEIVAKDCGVRDKCDDRDDISGHDNCSDCIGEEDLDDVDVECTECGKDLVILEGDEMVTCDCGKEMDRSDV